jgi:hypothetical protein
MELIEFLRENLPENKRIQISSTHWDGYVSSYPGLRDKQGLIIPTNKTLSAKNFEGMIPEDALEIISKISEAKVDREYFISKIAQKWTDDADTAALETVFYDLQVEYLESLSDEELNEVFKDCIE